METIRSVQESVFIPRSDITFEHIIFDDASTDGTESFFKSSPFGSSQNITYIRSEKNMGPSFGRNAAIARSTGDYVFLIDSDDILLQRTLFNFSEKATKHPEAHWFISDFLQTDEKLRYLVGKDYFSISFKNTQEHLRAIFKGENFIQSNVFFKKELFQKCGGFDETMKMSEDLDLFIRFFLDENMPIYCNFVSHLHRFHDSNLSTNVTLETHLEHIQQLREKYKIPLQKHGII